MKTQCNTCKQSKNNVRWRRETKQWQCESCYQLAKPIKNVIAQIKNPIRTGMALALGFFLMTILLTFLGWLFIGASCTALIGQF